MNNFTLVMILPSFGMMIGAFFGGKLLPKYGSRKVTIVANIVAVAFTVLKLVENTACIMVGRLVNGLLIGMTSVCLSHAISNTVPAKESQKYGGFVNAGFGIGIFFSNLLGLIIPLDKGNPGDVDRMLEDQNWRIILGFPLAIQLYCIIVLIWFIKYDSINDLLQNESETSPILHKEL
jgi:MFS family permease